MTRIDFYVLADGDERARLVTACRVAEKAWLQGLRVHIHTSSPALSTQMDNLLWSFRDGCFVPHAIEPEECADFPVTIGHDWEPPLDCAVVVNLAPETPRFFGRCERVAEVVNQEPAVRDAGRERYRFYRDRGYELHHHEIGG